MADPERRTGLVLALRKPGPRPKPSAETAHAELFRKL
jgi:hypothetical protein